MAREAISNVCEGPGGPPDPDRATTICGGAPVAPCCPGISSTKGSTYRSFRKESRHLLED
ncbi:hypothetical protein E2C01_063598 [Portunus trituberculatus]|uniref:Uncharacterized protein n=1 Tax=Portunus trituberculatus TaxID=210409 RepID=A0A5B7HIK8_PORTR|nr:hypothetical protein [Portunus trituberculatus]